MAGLQPTIARRLSAVLLLLLASCQSSPPAPVSERTQPPSQKILHHIVSRGETLYSIAWRYELDFQRLAAVNDLRQPYNLAPGQKLSLDMSGSPTPSASPPPRNKPAAVTAYPLEKAPEVRPEPPPKVDIPPPPTLPPGGWAWQWPVRGEVSREYDVSRVLKGISIHTGSRSAVAAAAPGIVVYAGEGLRGYGRLVILKHSANFLSAYAHNHRILVEENQSVARGQQIAEVGQDINGRHRLYFEIREDGKPVDPLKLLPK